MRAFNKMSIVMLFEKIAKEYDGGDYDTTNSTDEWCTSEKALLKYVAGIGDHLREAGVPVARIGFDKNDTFHADIDSYRAYEKGED